MIILGWKGCILKAQGPSRENSSEFRIIETKEI